MFNIQLCIKMGAIRVVFTCWPIADTRKPLNFMTSLYIAAAMWPDLASITHAHTHTHIRSCMIRYMTVINCNKQSQFPVTYVDIISTRWIIDPNAQGWIHPLTEELLIITCAARMVAKLSGWSTYQIHFALYCVRGFYTALQGFDIGLFCVKDKLQYVIGFL